LGATVVVGALVDDDTSVEMSTVVDGNSVLEGEDKSLASLVPQPVATRVHAAIVVMNGRENFMWTSTTGVEQ
jgi:hypothetical protein